MAGVRQITTAAHGHILTNYAVWSPDGRRIVYDTRSDPAGDLFDGNRIETVDVETLEVRVLYESRRGARCGVATYHPTQDRVIFILGPEDPTPDWQYGPAHRQGVVVDDARPGVLEELDGRDLLPPFTPGALRGGSHVHVFSPDGRMVSFTYEDHVLAQGTAERELNQRNVGITVLGKPVNVPAGHPRNCSGSGFSVLITKTTDAPRPGSDDISRAFEEAWVGACGYRRPGGTNQPSALAFQGNVVAPSGHVHAEVFIVDLPDDLTLAGDGPLQGTATTRPRPPRGTVQRRLTFTADRRYPGVQGPRHWLRSAPDGSEIAFLMRDDAGIVQIWTVSPNGGPPRQVTHNASSIASAFTWSPDGSQIAHVMDGSICLTDARSGAATRVTRAGATQPPVRPEACVFSPDGLWLACVRPTACSHGNFNQIYAVDVAAR
jgi:hypothetical protein